MYVKIDKLFDVEGTDDGVLYVSSTEGISVGSIINIEWEVQRIEGPELFCRRRSPDEWSEEELHAFASEQGIKRCWYEGVRKGHPPL